MSKERIRAPFNREVFFENFTIGFDHGVMANPRQPVVDEYNKLYGTNHTIDEIQGYYDLAKWAKEDLGACDEKAMEIHDHLWNQRPDILLRAKPMPGAEAITKELTLRGKNFQIITSKPKRFVKSTFKWYRKNMYWIDKSQINIQNSEEMTGDIYKVWTINRTGVDAFFEDAIHHAKNIANYTDTLVILLNNGPIFDIPKRDRIIRIMSYKNRAPTLQEAQNALFND